MNARIMRSCIFEVRRLLPLGTLLGVALAAANPAGAYEVPSVERGFKPERAFHAGEVDNVRLFNGGLELAIPIGPRYPVGGGLSYSLTLSYSSQLWDYQPVQPPPGQTMSLTQAWPVRGANAGLGWRLSFGEYWDQTVIGAGACRDCWVSPDGGRHPFYQTLHPDLADDGPTMYTRDGTYLRMRLIAGGREIDFPDGSIHKFDSLGRLIEIRDLFTNWMRVVYGTNAWTISDSQGRQHTVNLTAVPHYGKAVSSVVFAAFGGTQATYDFTYATPQVPRSCMDTDPATSATMALPLLTAVGLPDGSSYSMPASSHWLTVPPAPCANLETDVPYEGLILGLTLPTLGKVEWTYGPYNFPAPIEGQDQPDPAWLNKTTGVSSRTLRFADGSLHGTWTYTQVLPEGQDSVESITQVTNPAGDRTDHYFHVGDEPEPTYGLPFSPLESAPGRPDLLRSTKVYDCTEEKDSRCTLVRTTFVKYRTDSPFVGGPEFNSRMEATSTVFHDDGGRFAAVDYSDFDGLGNYRTATTSGDFEAGNTRSVFVNYNPGRGTYPGSFTMPAPTETWLLATFDAQQTSEAGQTAKTEFCFEAATGFLLRERKLKTGTTRGATDLVTLYSRDAAGNVVREQRYGSDLGAVGTAALCTAGLGTEQARVDHGYQAGVLASSRPVQANGTPFSFYTVDRTIDPNTGLVATVRDPALVTTTYLYDNLGRMTTENPAFDAKTTYTYTRAQGATRANVLVRRIRNGGSTVLAESRVYVDDFGRPLSELRLMPSGAWVQRTSTTNAMGWLTASSEWEPSGAPNTAFTRYQDFDAFGRATRIEPADGAAHAVSMVYTGVRVVSRTRMAATGAAGLETEVSSSEHYDRQGRLLRVIEPAGAGGANVTTTYGYDEENRLSSVAVGGTQNRSFSHDNRGFLSSECHPEKGASGNGCITYGSYDVWGHAGRKTDGPHDLRLLYDRTGRATAVREWAGAQRPLKQWTYGTGTGAADRSNGKVKTAERFNYVVLGTFPYTALVRETYTYGGRSGRPSTRLTESFINPVAGGSPTDAFTQGFTWNELGDPERLDYPSRTGLPAGRVVTFGYTNGSLTSVPGYASSIGYHSSGLLQQVVRTNGITDVWAEDPHKMHRPASIQAWYQLGTPSAAARFLSGTYKYDGSGNVKRIGNAYFVYDKVGRVVDGHVFLGAGGGSTQVFQTYSYDSFGNVTAINTNGSTRLTPTSTASNRLTSGTYDAAGNLTSWSGATYDYGPFNEIWHHKNGNEEAIYVYTADDQRLWQYNYDLVHQWTIRDLAGKVLREYTNDVNAGTWTVERDYVYRSGVLLAAETPQGTRHLSVDHLGTPRRITDAAGADVAYHNYYPFGEEATSANQDTERMKFTGHERDLNSPAGTADDLDYLHARFSSPLTGRFLSVDPTLASANPMQPQTWNRYAYVANNPVNAIDPTGKRLIIVAKDKGLLQKLQEIVNQGLVGVDLVIDEYGYASLVMNAEDTTPTQESINLEAAIQEAISLDKTISLRLVDGDASVLFGQYTTGKVDVGDLQGAGGSPPLDGATIFMHEVSEQRAKQTETLDASEAAFAKAHTTALALEFLVSGYLRSAPDQVKLDAEMTGKMITTHQRGHESVTVTFEVVKGNVVQRNQ